MKNLLPSEIKNTEKNDFGSRFITIKPSAQLDKVAQIE
jgi:hypothetical protein